jgi:hypothetical protein
MEAVNTSETSVSNYQTKQRNTSDDSRLHTRRHKNLNKKWSQCMGRFVRYHLGAVSVTAGTTIQNIHTHILVPEINENKNSNTVFA